MSRAMLLSRVSRKGEIILQLSIVLLLIGVVVNAFAEGESDLIKKINDLTTTAKNIGLAISGLGVIIAGICWKFGKTHVFWAVLIGTAIILLGTILIATLKNILG